LVNIIDHKENTTITQNNNCFYQMKDFDHLQEKFYLSLQSQRVGVELNDKQYCMEKNPKHSP
jgi:hypothetical protein